MHLKKTDIAIMAMCTGLIVANLYYCQPLILLMAKDFKIPPGKAGSLNYITQLGYAAGLLFIVPLGDLFERKKQMLLVNGLTVISLIGAALAPSFAVLQVASFCLGFTTVVPQLILPLAAHLANPERRGKVIGSIMSGLLLGILLSRTVSGLVGDKLGWRAMYWIAAGVCSLVLLIMAVRFPKSSPQYKGTYRSIYRSMLQLLPIPALQEACIINALTFGTFAAFWATMVLYLGGAPFHMTGGQIGLFGLVGAAGALAAPIAGRIGDKRDPRFAILVGLIMVLLSYAMFYIFRSSIALLIIGIIILDFGVQAVHISNQTRVYALVPEARNRLNTIYMTSTFLGAAGGSSLGLFLWKLNGWTAFTIGGGAMMGVALMVYALYHKRTKQRAVSAA